uniref:7TM_GPCR_Srx domain-containing protein n=1 Tax=Steinernema glaseri TaxID=37863 RepID=A0A1I7YJM0_9BILA
MDNDNKVTEEDSATHVSIIMFTMSIASLVSNSYIVMYARKRKIFGYFFGHVLVHRSLMEAINSFITLSFFSTYIYWAYEVPTWLNTAITTFYAFNLSSAYVLHLVISINRCVAVFLPLRYDGIFDKRRSVLSASILIVLLGAIITSLSFYSKPDVTSSLFNAFLGSCSHFMFSRELYDIQTVDCDEDETAIDYTVGYPTTAYPAIEANYSGMEELHLHGKIVTPHYIALLPVDT